MIETIKTAQRVSLLEHQTHLKGCTRCPDMIQPVITGAIVTHPIMSVGQAPGSREGALQRPFAWTAGKTLFAWFERIGIDENTYRDHVYMAAVCRCFPGKNPKGSGDRVPNKQEIKACSYWLEREYDIIRPTLIIPIGKLAIAQYMPVAKLADVIGQQHHVTLSTGPVDVIPLPHPSGLSTWFRTEPGKTLLAEALHLIDRHPVWQSVFHA